jgi:diguanylate cyclase (GGDEF)-like protein
MTLNRQLVAAISALFLAALIGIEVIHLKRAQEHLQRQLESLAQDAATSLGLSLGALLRGGDIALAETILNPVFDRGHYERIELISLSGESLVSKSLSRIERSTYPPWFAELLPLVGPSAESLVNAGWRQLGRVRVKVHPHYAYEQLWATARDTLLYLLVIYAVALVFLRLFLLGVLRPLTAVERAAQEISAGNFVSIDSRPSTRELARVVEAMNALSRKVRETIAAETARADALQRTAYVDEVSGLLSRRGLSDQFANAYGEEREMFSGTFALIGIAELGAIDRELGQQRCDELLRTLARDIETVAKNARGFSARWAGAQFALALPNLDAEAARETLGGLRTHLALTIAEVELASRPTVHVGAVFGSFGHAEFDDLVDAAQEMLLRASEQPEHRIEVRETSAGGLTSARDVASLARFVPEEYRVVLVGQVALTLPGRELLHTEIMARIPDATGTLMTASQFMAVISRYGLSRRLDETVVERVYQTAQELPGLGPLSINLSVRSLEHGGFIEWLVRLVERMRSLAGGVVFELSEHGVVQNENAAARLAAALAKAGAGFAIDHFGVHRNSLALLPHFKPAYLKLASLHTANLRSDTGTRFLVESIVRAARQLDVPVIAQSVEDEAVLAELIALGVSGYQGFHAGVPAPWPAQRGIP